MSDNLIIPSEIGSEEVIGRLILHSFHYSESKKRLKDVAFLPRAFEINEISVLRFDYTCLDDCKRQGIILAERRNSTDNPCKFIGVVLLKCSQIEAVFADTNFSVEFKYTPLCVENNLRKDRPIKVTDEGFPNHASLVYDISPIAHNPITQEFKKKIIKPLVKLANNHLYKDENVSSGKWEGDTPK